MFTDHRLRTWLFRLLIPTILICSPTGAAEGADGQTAHGKPHMLELWSLGDTGQRMRIRGRVTSIDGRPLPNVDIRVRHADGLGLDWSHHQGVMTTNDRGIYQFGSVIPGNSHRLSHVHVYIDHPGFQYVDTEFYFKDDPKANPDDPNSIFLEESIVNGEVMMYGRWDITLTPK